VKEPTLLGEAFGPDGAIDPAGVDRVVEAVNRAMGAARRLGVQQLYVFTSAVRDAANRDLILDSPCRFRSAPGGRPGCPAGRPARPRSAGRAARARERDLAGSR
jgi:exopolyphosphatase / guanosine-5'-triphosphate,3'-diphosphate pyrophosphatase